MNTGKKGLADTGDGEFILNESGTSVSTDPVLPMTQPAIQTEIKEEPEDPDAKATPQSEPIK